MRAAAAEMQRVPDRAGVSPVAHARWMVGGVLLLLILLLTVFPRGASAATEKVRSFGPDGTESTSFGSVESISADQQEGWVYVLDGTAGTLSKFDQAGKPVDFSGSSGYISGNQISGLSPWTLDSSGKVVGGVAVDPSSHVIYSSEHQAIRAFSADGEPQSFTAGPGAGTSEIPGFTRLGALAVDAYGNIYASDFDANMVKIFAPSGALLTEISVHEPGAMAIGPSEVLYIVEGGLGLRVKRFTPSTVPVTDSSTFTESTFFEEPPASHVIIALATVANGDLYVLESDFSVSRVSRRNAAGEEIETSADFPDDPKLLEGFSRGIAAWPEPREVGLGETIALYVGDNKHHQVLALGKKILSGPPVIEHTSALDITADSATLRAWVDPNTAATAYHFEYGLEDCVGGGCTSLPEGQTGNGEDPVEVLGSISGLEPGTTYHYRVVAENSFSVEVTEGPDTTFTTQPFGIGFGLADNRVWEMVSPQNKHGGGIRGPELGLIQAASDGGGIAYVSQGSIVVDPDGSRARETASVIANRGVDGWTSRDITAANHRVVHLFVGFAEYYLFARDLSKGLLEPRDGTMLSPEASERAPYRWEDGNPPLFRPLVTSREGFANVPPGTEFGGPLSGESSVQLAGASSDLDHVVLSSVVPLTADAPKGAVKYLYLWSGGQLKPVSVLPAAEGGEVELGFVELGSGGARAGGAVSSDGSRVFWESGRYFEFNELHALYVRDTVQERTIRLDVPRADASGEGTSSPVFQGASTDGSVVYFSDTQRLTADASPQGRDLYRCEIPIGSLEEGCVGLVDLSAPLTGSGESAEMPGISAGMSEDGSRTYFVVTGVLDTVPNEHGETAAAGKPNLYLWQQGSGARFIATLAEGDKGDWGLGGNIYAAATSHLNAAVSPSGRYLAFMSQRSLTGQDSLSVDEGEPAQEVFRYDAVTNHLDCVSCNAFGAAPQAEVLPDHRTRVDPQQGLLEVLVAAALPGVSAQDETGVAIYRPRTALDNGRVFFNAFDSLVPSDSNGQWDAYQYEPTGVGSCSPASGDAATVRTAGGCVSLLSSGTAEGETSFLDASESGDDVFLLGPAQLSVSDVDQELDVYDVRVNGTAATLPSRGECQGEACQPSAQAPNDPTPGTATFTGPGNPKAAAPKRCPKGKHKVRRGGRVRCVRNKEHRAAKSHKHRKAGQNRRTAR